MLTTKTEYDWKIQHRGTKEKLEDSFIMEVKNDVDTKLHSVTDDDAAVDKIIATPTVVDNNAATVDKTVATAMGNIADLSSTDDEHEVNVNLHAGAT